MRLLILFSDPELIFDKAQTGEEGFEGALDLFPQSFSLKQVQPELSGEIVMKDLLRFLLHCCARIPNLRLYRVSTFSSREPAFLLLSAKNKDSGLSQSRKSANNGLPALLRILRN